MGAETTTVEHAPAVADTPLDVLLPHAAFNLYMQTSVVLLDCCSTQFVIDDAHTSATDAPSPDGVLAGSAWLDASLPLPVAAEAAYRHVMDERTPDDDKTALVLFDDLERARSLAAWLGGCGVRRVLGAERAAMRRDHPYLLCPGAQELVLPSEIVPGRLYLGSAASINASALRLLNITAVVSLLERELVLPDPRCRHLLLQIADDNHADLDSAIRAALPFISAEHALPHGRVLVHCQAGQSRSASIVTAALMASPQLTAVTGRSHGSMLSVKEALDFVRAQRPQVRPNDGFMKKLHARAWMGGENTEPVAPDWF